MKLKDILRWLRQAVVVIMNVAQRRAEKDPRQTPLVKELIISSEKGSHLKHEVYLNIRHIHDINTEIRARKQRRIEGGSEAVNDGNQQGIPTHPPAKDAKRPARRGGPQKDAAVQIHLPTQNSAHASKSKPHSRSWADEVGEDKDPKTHRPAANFDDAPPPDEADKLLELVDDSDAESKNGDPEAKREFGETETENNAPVSTSEHGNTESKSENSDSDTDSKDGRPNLDFDD